MNRDQGEDAVAAYMSDLQHPMKEAIEEVRAIILSVDASITERIKWNAPSFCYCGEDRITFQLHGSGFFRLVFHCGAKVKGAAPKEPLIADSAGLLQWAANDRAIVKFTSTEDVRAKRDKLLEVVAKWLKAAST
ncbi:DUF1801 domain-containing protein [Paenibacillus ginsengarvi]|uniref:DUF1801 domain-containing protein n=1 Tax=Paenibacillus ginsengarvi TaxID=400777 RepID=A0A3B0CKL5_9BACL|nr:DUF1801 domain-containing protein [Paenibacillus ginsengarvi]RKN84546.1 DUF1801 domain-containing protein [Paenibacillus ginsengarvi]